MSSAPTTAPPDVSPRPVAVWLGLTFVVMLLLAGLAAIIARKGQTWGIKSETLHIAAVHWPEDIVPLIRSGRDVNELMGGRTPLDQAVTFGKVESVRLLLEHGADPDLYDPGGATSGAVARSSVHHGGSHGSGPNGPPLASPHLHLRHSDDRAIVLILLDAGADPDARGVFGRTRLHEAVDLQDHYLVRRLIDLGADVNSRDDRDRTPLHEAVAKGDPIFVEMLLDAGADPLLEDKLGRKPADLTGARRLDESLQKRLQPDSP